MPRKKPRDLEQTLEPVIALPVRTGHHKPHDVDPYEAPPGAIAVRTTHRAPLERPLTGADLQARDTARTETRLRAERYVAFVDALARTGGDDVNALAQVYDISVDQARLSRMELLADVRQGLPHSTLADHLQHNDLDVAARLRVLRRHVYSDTPAASLKALDMIGDMEGTRNDAGSFESYLRLVKESA